MTTHPGRSAAPPPSRRGFTLIELLVVVGIIGMLLAISMAAFQGIGAGAKMRTATFEVRTALALARQHAVAQRVGTWVVFPHVQSAELPDINWSDDPRLRNAPYQAYCIVCTNNGYDMYEWRFLPKGVIFLRPPMGVAGTDNIFTLSLSGSASNNVYWLQFPTTNSINQFLFAVGFNSQGRLIHTGGTTPEIFLTEGSVDINPSSGALISYITKGSSSTNGLAVRPLTGQVKIREY